MVQKNQSADIQACLDRLRRGDDSAQSALLECACERLTRLARKMLKGFPQVHRWEETDDVRSKCAGAAPACSRDHVAGVRPEFRQSRGRADPSRAD